MIPDDRLELKLTLPANTTTTPHLTRHQLYLTNKTSNWSNTAPCFWVVRLCFERLLPFLWSMRWCFLFCIYMPYPHVLLNCHLTPRRNWNASYEATISPNHIPTNPKAFSKDWPLEWRPRWLQNWRHYRDMRYPWCRLRALPLSRPLPYRPRKWNAIGSVPLTSGIMSRLASFQIPSMIDEMECSKSASLSECVVKLLNVLCVQESFVSTNTHQKLPSREIQVSSLESYNFVKNNTTHFSQAMFSNAVQYALVVRKHGSTCICVPLKRWWYLHTTSGYALFKTPTRFCWSIVRLFQDHDLLGLAPMISKIGSSSLLLSSEVTMRKNFSRLNNLFSRRNIDQKQSVYL